MRATANKILACTVAVLAALHAAGAETININRLVDEKSSVRMPTAKNIENLDLRTEYAAALADNATAAASKPEAKAPSDAEKPRNEKPVLEDRFAKGTRRVGAFGGMAQAFDDDETIFFAGVSGEYFVIDDLSLRGELIGYSVDQRNSEDTKGGGFNALARWYCLKSKDSRLSMFLEGGGGIAEFNGRTPGPEGTDFEFTLHAGFGGDFKLTECISLIAAPRYLHVSNAFIRGRSRHGTIDSVGGYLGISVKF